MSTSQELLTATRSWDRGMNGFVLGISKRIQPYREPDFRLLASRTDKRIISYCFKPSSL